MRCRVYTIRERKFEPTIAAGSQQRGRAGQIVGRAGAGLEGPQGTPTKYLDGPSDERHAQFSPDCRWVANASDETGRFEVCVQAAPAAEGKRQIATQGGSRPRCRKDGKELYYLSADGKVMAVPVTLGARTLENGAGERLFDLSVAIGNYRAFLYAPAANGQKFLASGHQLGIWLPVVAPIGRQNSEGMGCLVSRGRKLRPVHPLCASDRHGDRPSSGGDRRVRRRAQCRSDGCLACRRQCRFSEDRGCGRGGADLSLAGILADHRRSQGFARQRMDTLQELARQVETGVHGRHRSTMGGSADPGFPGSAASGSHCVRPVTPPSPSGSASGHESRRLRQLKSQ